MSDIAIRAEGLGKMYRIGGPKRKYRTIRETIVDTAKMPFQRARSVIRGEAAGGGHESFWALNDISFEIKQGEVVGIIGHNGAGKSTLLKILSRITEPNAGYVDVYGRVGSLLEVGTGFHPELTGRENIYLNGAILGMTRDEINRKFDEIVGFAGVEKFIDTPVKHYSSGMSLRLGFAVAAHLEPEILVVDEVLAVGDAEFQRKCLGKMDEVAKAGRTVLLVSHNMSAILNLCTRTIWLNRGEVKLEGDTLSVIQSYLDTGILKREIDLSSHTGRRQGKDVFMHTARLLSGEANNAIFETGQSFGFEVDCFVPKDGMPNINLGFALKDGLGGQIFGTNMMQTGQAIVNTKGKYTLKATIDTLPLTPGRYSLSLFLGNGITDLDVIDGAFQFDVIWNTTLGYPPKPHWGFLYSPIRWEAVK
jgi:lipopolysaccharide transport system ATP-binding protein